jgi:flavin-dependent dehydrogenase
MSSSPTLSPVSSRVVIVGAGVAGLACALALKGSRQEVIIVERDDEPETMDPVSAFDAWRRPGVPQFHHTHIFLARLQTIVRDRHPELLEDLARAGILRSSIDQILPMSLADKYEPKPNDRDLLHLWGRRATFEYVLRRHVGRLENTRFLHSTHIENLVVEKAGRHLRVRGVEIRRGGSAEVLHADVVVDASGVRSKMADWLRGHGALIRTDAKPSPCAYFCRHFRQRDPSSEPPRRGTGASLDYLVFGTFFAEEGTFSIAFACPETEEELSEFIRKPEGFDHVCRRIPALERWTSRSDPISRVLGGGGLANRWNHYPRRGPHVLGFFPVGDSYIQTNPIFGRGCSQAFVQAEVLGEVLVKESDPLRRARLFHARVRKLLKPHFDFSVAADKAMVARAKVARGDPLSLVERLMSFLYERVFGPAIEHDAVVAREWLRAQQMQEISAPWVGLIMVLRVVAVWVMLRLRGAREPLRSFGPERADMLRSLPEPGSAATAE